jgi:hypothetical protein
MNPIQPTIELVVVLMQSSINPTLLLEGDASFKHVISISSTAPSEQERFLLSLSALPPNLGEVPFEWDGLVGYQIPPPIPFQVRDIL